MYGRTDGRFQWVYLYMNRRQCLCSFTRSPACLPCIIYTSPIKIHTKFVTSKRPFGFYIHVLYRLLISTVCSSAHFLIPSIASHPRPSKPMATPTAAPSIKPGSSSHQHHSPSSSQPPPQFSSPATHNHSQTHNSHIYKLLPHRRLGRNVRRATRPLWRIGKRRVWWLSRGLI